jgi:Leucine-rich repeat (LRR) protein
MHFNHYVYSQKKFRESIEQRSSCRSVTSSETEMFILMVVSILPSMDSFEPKDYFEHYPVDRPIKSYKPSTWDKDRQSLALDHDEIRVIRSWDLEVRFNGKWEILPDLSCFVNLQRLIICQSKNLARIPDLTELVHLRSLEICMTSIDELPDLSRNHRLKRLVCCANEKPFRFSPLPERIEELHLHCNNLVAIPDLSGLKRLKTLVCPDNKLKALPRLHLKCLKELSVVRNDIRDLPDLSDAVNLEYLDCNLETLWSLRDGTDLSRLPKLQIECGDYFHGHKDRLSSSQIDDLTKPGDNHHDLHNRNGSRHQKVHKHKPQKVIEVLRTFQYASQNHTSRHTRKYTVMLTLDINFDPLSDILNVL